MPHWYFMYAMGKGKDELRAKTLTFLERYAKASAISALSSAITSIDRVCVCE